MRRHYSFDLSSLLFKQTLLFLDCCKTARNSRTGIRYKFSLTGPSMSILPVRRSLIEKPKENIERHNYYLESARKRILFFTNTNKNREFDCSLLIKEFDCFTRSSFKWYLSSSVINSLSRRKNPPFDPSSLDSKAALGLV